MATDPLMTLPEPDVPGNDPIHGKPVSYIFCAGAHNEVYAGEGWVDMLPKIAFMIAIGGGMAFMAGAAGYFLGWAIYHGIL